MYINGPAAPETRQHFIAECSAYTHDRKVCLEKLRNNPVLPDRLCLELQNSEFLTQLILDPSVNVDSLENLEFLELCSKEYIDQIHRRRVARLNQISQC